MIYTQTLKVIDGKPTISVSVTRKNVTYEFYRRNEDKTLVRNLYGNQYRKWVQIPGFKYGWYNETATEEPWSEIIPNYHGNLSKPQLVTQEEIDLFEKFYPGFHYVIEKSKKNWFFSWEQFFDLLPIWKKNPKVEILIDKGFSIIAWNKTFWKAKPETQKKFLQALKQCEGYNPTLDMVRKVAQGVTPKRYLITHSSAFYNHNTRKYEVTEEIVKYLEKNDIEPREYTDYIHMAKCMGHKTTDPYWAFPKNFRKMHNKVLAENEAKKALENRKGMEPWEKKYAKKVKKYNCILAQKGIKVYVPQSIFEYTHQAEKLHQCIVFAKYYQKVAEGKSLLVFIHKNKQPYATAELLKKGSSFTLGQFYGDEHLPDFHAKPDAVEAFDKWIQKQKIKISNYTRSICA